MQASEVEALVKAQYPEMDVVVETDGYHYQLRAVGQEFAGLNKVKRQQLVYGCLNAHIVDGTIHAVIMQTYTPEEWAEQNS
ncbi:cell division protein BolA [Oleiphilus sp. HI0009]|nr:MULTISPECIES: BolA/IbaG family iron-sulfur metabolism protein [unclassified Oleiphilus]KZX82612.1 cell division protein BolA [Oleiphilus sp. HI0009]MCH2157619.1 BolA/IbaG family iron-sulfur metabolism protein [Oleiphilaceae bacterium]KZX84261.1 cell division protein BolA [Oleiphilus sp. HI0009]KZY65460.1 cell division protein BolA [Oleiphilus sp. HI0066]KZY69185.1 cell division protein BolA [Oleiphilus sp. HI0067]